MKKLFVIFALIITGTFLYGQKSIDNLFEKYAGKDGFTTVTVNGGLLKLAHIFGDNDDDIFNSFSCNRNSYTHTGR